VTAVPSSDSSPPPSAPVDQLLPPPPGPPEGRALSPGEIAVSDVIGRLIEFWGFKRNMGRVWAVLYLSPEPLAADDLRNLLRLSSGAVSMTLSELARWGVVRKVWVQGERKDFFIAEVHLWKMISRVFGEREKVEIVSAIEAFEAALRALDRAPAHGTTTKDPDTQRRVDLQRERITKLLELAKMGQGLLDALLSTAKLDAGPLMRFLLGQKPGDEPRSPSTP
jgi:HTH-type transcriptional regulator, glycine betaine synthesis regulator